MFFILQHALPLKEESMAEGQKEFEAGQGHGGIPCLTLPLCQGRQMAAVNEEPTLASPSVSHHCRLFCCRAF